MAKKPWKPKLTDEQIRNGYLNDLKEAADRVAYLFRVGDGYGIEVSLQWPKQEDGSYLTTIRCHLKL